MNPRPGAGYGDQQQRHRRMVGAGSDVGQRRRRQQDHARRQAVAPVDEVDGVGEEDDPEDGQHRRHEAERQLRPPG